ncbi:phage holin family protein [Teichococcus vastitatis]|jgi:uncharacterized membrane protein YphA (DoxX/SURF4 family)|uniref:Phage holin family protein n=1 Tax=Teichococcus vastitatis TaxID=2307076 RepID=A0ABS9VZ73_9PROT|nr:phage holin family protein [Pseudoroseomonas vastitatis]MCI0752292.1 phage holin family protein [Pseudoroseomonas vastitatis]
MALDPQKSVPDLLSDLVRQSSSLVQQEMQLARTEVSEKVSKLGAGAASIGVAAALLMAGVVILLQAAVALLVSFGVSTPLAGLIVGGVVALIAYILLRSGMNAMKADSLMPKRTTEQLSRDATMAKEAVR